MASVKVTVYGRVKPCPKNLQSKEFRIREGENEDYITFSMSKPLPTKKTYRFRKIFTEKATQEEVFDVVAKPVIENVLSGYNGTIFTYGQTGSGKTYTMTGDIERWISPGLIPRTIQRLFQMKGNDVMVSVTYCEIYNEHVYDLIRSNRLESDVPHVSLVDDSSGVTNFRNLSVHSVATAYEAIQLLVRGDANKMMAETMSNAKSSRSHVLFSINLEVPHPSQEKFYLKPVLYLVDLAGSEKLSKCKSQMTNPWETRYINLSLHYLEQVLLALRQPGRVHIPYRNSLMTALLRNSLGGNCITAMIATFCLSTDDLDETVQTCRFSERIALIKNDIKLTDVFNPERELDELRKENKMLRSQIKLLNSHMDEGELTEEDKDKCSEMVQSFIHSSSIDCLPLTDVRRMEYCFCLMRDAVLKKPKRETDVSTKCENATDFFNRLGAQSDAQEQEKAKSVALTAKKSETSWKKKKTMNIPKVNITYKPSETTEPVPDTNEGDVKNDISAKPEPAGDAKEVNKEDSSSEIAELSTTAPKKSCRKYQIPFFIAKRLLGKKADILCPNVGMSTRSSEEEIEITEEGMCGGGGSLKSHGDSPSSTTYQIDVDDEKNTGSGSNASKRCRPKKSMLFRLKWPIDYKLWAIKIPRRLKAK